MMKILFNVLKPFLWLTTFAICSILVVIVTIISSLTIAHLFELLLKAI
jgi:hypothetical protein